MAALFLPGAVAAQVVLTEFLASNSTGIRDEINEREDWLELTNTSAGTVSLSRY
ncbi:MAG: hypothetical protein ACKV19_06300 [Verrucomicrobiales bacterium]